MKLKDRLYAELNRRMQEKGICEDDVFTAQDLSESLQISRNTVSQYLNEFVKEEKCIKINSRPVYFFSKEMLEKIMGKAVSKTVFDSFEEVACLQNRDFDELIGNNGSLVEQIEQCQAAISYPGNGLPLLIYGPTGTGKTMIAGCIEKYARNHGIIAADARMLSVNCSEYANNPELLTDNLFGHVKGAYTGADDESDGLISLADGGILFLDEVHCLKPECQEKLFQFMDKGIFHKVGDNDNWFASKCRLIFATTQNPQDALLKTLLRRIPITITIPALSERPMVEKRELIYSMLSKEAKKLNSEVYISNSAFQALMDYEYKGNIGELKNAIKATCANVYVRQKQEKLQIHLLDLPHYFFDDTRSIAMKTYDPTAESMISVHDLHTSSVKPNCLLELYERLLETFDLYDYEKESEDIFAHRCHSYINSFIDYLFFKEKYQSVTSNEEYLLKIADKIYSIVMNKYSFTIPNNKIRIYSKIFVEYAKYETDARIWVKQHEKSVIRFRTMITETYPRTYTIADDIIGNVALNLDITMDPFMWIVLTLALLDLQPKTKNGRVGLILCHGYSTASSIADTANHMLSEHIFDGIDMELQTSIDKMAALVNSYLKQKSPIQELLLLVDMGSLEAIYERINPLSDCNIGLFNHVSTASAIEIGNYIQQGKKAKEIIRLMQEQQMPSFRFIEGKKKQDAILTLCATGFGAAKKISELLLHSLPRPIDLQILPCDYNSLKEHGIDDVIFSDYNVKLLIGTLNPEVEGIPYMGIESIMANEEIQVLNQLIADCLDPEDLALFGENIMKNFTLSNMVNHLTILNPEKVMDDAEEIVEELEDSFHVSLESTTKVGLYVHLSCLIERLLLKQGIEDVDGVQEFKKNNSDRFEIVRNAFSVVEMRYSVEISDPEIMYILNYF